MFELALAAGWGLLLGGINHWIIARPLGKSWQRQQLSVNEQQALVKKLYARFLFRMLINLGGIGLAFYVWRDMTPLAAVLGGLLVVNMLSIRQHRRRRSTV